MFGKRMMLCCGALMLCLALLTGCVSQSVPFSDFPTDNTAPIATSDGAGTVVSAEEALSTTDATQKNATTAPKNNKTVSRPAAGTTTAAVQTGKKQPTTAQPTTAATVVKNPEPLAGFTPVSPAAYYGRSQLAQQENGAALLKAYDRIVAGAERLEASISLQDAAAPITPAEFETVFTCYRNDYPQHFWRDDSAPDAITIAHVNGYVTEVRLTYSMKPEEVSAAAAALEEKAKTLLQAAAAGKDAYSREKLLHDALAKSVSYEEAPHAHDAYGALVEGKAVCEGYAKAFQYLLNQAGIPCTLVTGSSSLPGSDTAIGHAWNLVNIDGEYYHVDVTWDDQEILSYAYFNLTTGMISTDHIIEDDPVYSIPDCTATAANYHYRNGSALTAYDAATIAALLKKNDGVAALYLLEPASVDGFVDWFKENHIGIAKELGLGSSAYRFSVSQLEREVHLMMKKS